MIEKNIVDRVPTHAGRIRLLPVQNQENTFDMVRADDPIVTGTPIDKATLDGISKNRLTGRYYDLTATRVTLSTAGGATNPIPTSWVNTTATGATSGGYSIEASGTSGSYQPYRAFDGQTSTYWVSNATTEPWIVLNVPEGITVNKFKIAFKQSESWSTQTQLQGQATNGAWHNLNTLSLPSNANLTEHTISSPSTYRAYRLKFTIAREAEITLYEFQISNWESATYRYDYTLSTNIVPSTWEKGQRVTVFVPNNSITSVTQNNFNGIKINTILQPNRQYELVYNGTTFDAKGV